LKREEREEKKERESRERKNKRDKRDRREDLPLFHSFLLDSFALFELLPNLNVKSCVNSLFWV
jgi:hypothetical protein